MELRREELRRQFVTSEYTDGKMATETREDLEQELKDLEFASYYGADQAKIQLAFTLVDARDQLNLTQKEVADNLKVSQPYIAKLERGDANPTIGKIGSMLAQLGLRLNMKTEPLLPQPVVHHIMVQMKAVPDLVIGAAATAVGTGITFGEESNVVTAYTTHASPDDLTIMGSLTMAGGVYIRGGDVRKPALVGGTVE